MAEQLSFDLPTRAALGRGDFFVTPSNAVAMAMIENWPAWTGRKLALTGPEGAGKTHLAHVWAALCGARIVAAASLPGADIADLAQGHVAVEDVPLIAGNRPAEEALFHLHNLVLAEGNALLLTGTPDPYHWALGLPDLASRMQGTGVARLGAPDDALLQALLAKLFADRQISPTPGALTYLARRIDRSHAAAREIVARLDQMAMATGREINRALAARALSQDPGADTPPD